MPYDRRLRFKNVCAFIEVVVCFSRGITSTIRGVRRRLGSSNPITHSTNGVQTRDDDAARRPERRTGVNAVKCIKRGRQRRNRTGYRGRRRSTVLANDGVCVCVEGVGGTNVLRSVQKPGAALFTHPPISFHYTTGAASRVGRQDSDRPRSTGPA